MKCIVLAKMSKRIIAAVIDLFITAGLAILVFFTLVYPFTLDKDQYIANQNACNKIYESSEMYIKVTDDKSYNYQLPIDILSDAILNGKVTPKEAIPSLNDYVIKEEHYNIVNDVFKFYMNEEFEFDGKGNGFFTNESNEYDVLKNVFKVGSEESNIKSIVKENGIYKIETLIEETQEKMSETFTFIYQIFNNTDTENLGITYKIQACPIIKTLTDRNNDMMLFSLLMIIPTMFGFSFIFYFIIPICSKNGETIGKYFTGLVVLSADGYELKKYLYIPRFFSFFVFEFAASILTIGSAFLITYIMFCFTKKRRCIHDFCSNSVVVDKKESSWFKNREQEYLYNNRTEI